MKIINVVLYTKEPYKVHRICFPVSSLSRFEALLKQDMFYWMKDGSEVPVDNSAMIERYEKSKKKDGSFGFHLYGDIEPPYKESCYLFSYPRKKYWWQFWKNL